MIDMLVIRRRIDRNDSQRTLLPNFSLEFDHMLAAIEDVAGPDGAVRSEG